MTHAFFYTSAHPRCPCGWSAEYVPDFNEAERLYKEHVRRAERWARWAAFRAKVRRALRWMSKICL